MFFNFTRDSSTAEKPRRAVFVLENVLIHLKDAQGHTSLFIVHVHF